MAIFSRRILQRLLDENSQFLLEGQTKKHVEQLNRMHEELTLAYEWEVVVLNALSKIGKVAHEFSSGGGRKAGIHFEAFDHPGTEFVADITAISDRGLDSSNPIEALSNRLNELVEKCGLRPNCFTVEVGEHPGPAYKGGPKIKLKLPGQARFTEKIFDRKFNNFIQEIQQSPNRIHRYEVKSDDADVVISYNPDQGSASIMHLSYTLFQSLTENAVYQALESKAAQLLGTNFKGPLGIFLCDGGSNLINRSSTLYSYSFDEVVQAFLSRHVEINFVITLTSGRKNPVGGSSHRMNPYLTFIRTYRGLKYDQIPFDLLFCS
jgi:hypothetical protein